MPKTKGGQASVGMWQALRDVLIASINKGQFLVALTGLICLVVVARMTPADLGKLVFRLLDASEARYLSGYALSVVLVISWFVHSRFQRRVITRELERISKERNSLQTKALGGSRVKSSEGRT